MKNKFIKLTSLLALISLHIFFLLKSSVYVTPEIIFPAWLLSNARSFVSESQSLYPPLLIYIVSFINKIFQNLFISATLTQLLLVVIVDCLLLYYLNKKFEFKYAVLGLCIYAPWQVFFRGNYLWYDFATIPFIAVSYLFFENFVANLKERNLLLASSFLSLGYFFKTTILWIYGLYSVWVIIFLLKNKIKSDKYIKYIIFLLGPLVLAFLTNFLIILSKGTFAFSLYWNVVIQILIYPRLPTLARPISANYLPVIILLLFIYILCFYVVKKHSKTPKLHVQFLFSFSLVSIANIFPRWSDFHMQPFIFFLAIVFTYACYSLGKAKISKIIYSSIFAGILGLTLLILGNRIIVEMRYKNILHPDYNTEFTPSELTNLIKNKSVFLEDQALYNHPPINYKEKLNFYKQLSLMIGKADEYYRITNWQEALSYLKYANSDFVIIPYQIENRIKQTNDLTPFESYVSQKYQEEANINKIYYFYGKRQN